MALSKFRNIRKTTKLSIYWSNSVTLRPLEIDFNLVLKTKMVCNLVFIRSMHIFVHFSSIT